MVTCKSVIEVELCISTEENLETVKVAHAPKQKISYEKKVDPAITEYSVRALNWLEKLNS